MSGGSAMNYLEELSTVVDRLTAEGYTDVFRAEAGALRALTHDALFRPEELAIDGVYRGSVSFTAEEWSDFGRAIRDESYWSRKTGTATPAHRSGSATPSGLTTVSYQQPDGGLNVWSPGTSRGRAPRSSFETYRTVCVRLCDGYFWPVSFTTDRGGFKADERACRSSCGAVTKLFYYANPGQQPEDMVDLQGRPYKKLRTAFRYAQQYVAQCKCRPDPWEQAAHARHRMYADLKKTGKLKSYLARLDKKMRRDRPQRSIRYANFGGGLTAGVATSSLSPDEAKKVLELDRRSGRANVRMTLGVTGAKSGTRKRPRKARRGLSRAFSRSVEGR